MFKKWQTKLERTQHRVCDLEGSQREIKERIKEIDKKIELILEHLELEYVPESRRETIESAHLTERLDLSNISSSGGGLYISGGESWTDLSQYVKENQPNKCPDCKATFKTEHGLNIHRGQMKGRCKKLKGIKY